MLSQINLRDYTDGNAGKIMRKVAKTNEAGLQDRLEVAHGPLPKNQATIDYEIMVRALLNEPENVRFTKNYQNNEAICTIGSKVYNVNQTIKNMDARTLHFTDAELATYVHELKRGKLRSSIAVPMLSPENVIRLQDATGHYEDLHYGHMLAINLYTSDYYKVMNAILRGRNSIHDYNGDPIEYMPHALIHIGMASMGLSKIPDTHVKYAFRADGHVLTNNELQQRLDSIDKPNTVTLEEGFVSTSAEKLQWTKGDKIMYHDVIGKEIRDLSCFPDEQELLMPPTQIKWEGHEQVNNTHYFVARPIVTLAGLSPEQAMMGITADQIEAHLKQIAALDNKVGEKPKGLDKVKAKQRAKLAQRAESLLYNHPELTDSEKLTAINEAGEAALRRVQKVKRFQKVGHLGKQETTLNLEDGIKQGMRRKTALEQMPVKGPLKRNEAKRNLKVNG